MHHGSIIWLIDPITPHYTIQYKCRPPPKSSTCIDVLAKLAINKSAGSREREKGRGGSYQDPCVGIYYSYKFVYKRCSRVIYVSDLQSSISLQRSRASQSHRSSIDSSSARQRKQASLFSTGTEFKLHRVSYYSDTR